MDVVNEIEVLENDVKDCNEKCQRVNCSAIYDAIMSSFKGWLARGDGNRIVGRRRSWTGIKLGQWLGVQARPPAGPRRNPSALRPHAGLASSQR